VTSLPLTAGHPAGLPASYCYGQCCTTSRPNPIYRSVYRKSNPTSTPVLCPR